MANPANAITLGRLVLALIAVGLLIGLPVTGCASAVLPLFIVASALDLADGWAARRLLCATPLGAMLDPLVDKMIVSMFLVALFAQGAFDGWAVAAAIGRDVAVQAMRVRALADGKIFPRFGVSNTRNVVQLGSIAVALLSLQCAPGSCTALLEAAARWGLWTSVALGAAGMLLAMRAGAAPQGGAL